MNYTFANFAVTFRFTIPKGKIRIRKIISNTIFRDWTNSRDYPLDSIWSMGFYDDALNGRDVGAIRPSTLTSISGLSLSQGNSGGIIFSNALPYNANELVHCDNIMISANMATPANVALPLSYQAINQINFWYEDE